MEVLPSVPGVLQEIQGSRVPFTNFSIEEILKPDFGRRQLTTGILNLTMRRSHSHENGRSLCTGASTTSLMTTNSNNINNRSPSGNENSRARTLSHSVKNICSSNSQSKLEHSRIVSGTSSGCGSDGESSNSSSCDLSPTSSPQSDSSSSNKQLWPAWVYCTRYSDRPSSGPRSRKVQRKSKSSADDKRPRTAFSTEQLKILKQEFETSRYLTEARRQSLARELNLNESQIKIWFQNKRAKNKKTSGEKNALALELMAQGLYNHKTVHHGENAVKMEM